MKSTNFVTRISFLINNFCIQFAQFGINLKVIIVQIKTMNQKLQIPHNSCQSSQHQTDQLIKAKIAQFILSYQKSTLDKQFKKQKIKQTIMIDLLSIRNAQNNKNKNLPSSSSTAEKQSTVKDFQMSMEMSNISKNSKRGSKNSISEENVGKIMKKIGTQSQSIFNQKNINIEQIQERNSKLIPDFFHPNKSRASFKNSSVKEYLPASMTQQDQQKDQIPSFGLAMQKSSKSSLTERNQKSDNQSELYKRQKAEKYSPLTSPTQQQCRLPLSQQITLNDKNNLSSHSKKFTDSVFKGSAAKMANKQQQNLVNNKSVQIVQQNISSKMNQNRDVKILDYEEDQNRYQKEQKQQMGSTTFGRKNQSLINMNLGTNLSNISHQKLPSQIYQNNFIKKPNVNIYFNDIQQMRNRQKYVKKQEQHNSNSGQEQEKLQDQHINSRQQEQIHYGQQVKYKNLTQQKQQNYGQYEEQQNQGENRSIVSDEDEPEISGNKPIDFIEENHSMQTSKVPLKQIQKSKKREQLEPLNSQNSKSYAFQILMDKSTLQDKDIEQLRRKKIIQMEKKRLQRLEAHSKNKNSTIQEQPSSKAPYLRNSKINNHSKEHNRDSLNKSGAEKPQRLLNHSKKQQNQSNFSHFDDRQTVASKYYEKEAPSNSQANTRQLSPYGRTPKTIQSTKTNVPLNKQTRENIFVQEPSSTFIKQNKRQKNSSSQKYIPTEPKIQPKTVKSTFTKHSNRKLMINAVTYTCLPGQLNRRERQRLIDVLESCEQNEYFIFLFKQYSRKVIKGIYVMEIDQTKINRIYGDKAPFQITSQMIHQFYRFDSGSRQFKKIDGCKSFSFSVHAIDLK